jgi:hypothetical protein
MEDDDEMEPSIGVHNWDEAFRQNPDQPVFDVPDWMRDMNHGRETAEDAQARALAQEAQEWAAIAHLDTGDK